LNESFVLANFIETNINLDVDGSPVDCGGKVLRALNSEKLLGCWNDPLNWGCARFPAAIASAVGSITHHRKATCRGTFMVTFTREGIHGIREAQMSSFFFLS
jgi:hypothetical protein